MRPGTSPSVDTSAYFVTPCTSEEAQLPTPMMATFMLPLDT